MDSGVDLEAWYTARVALALELEALLLLLLLLAAGPEKELLEEEGLAELELPDLLAPLLGPPDGW